ncbi:small oligopeptide transporter [Pholiota molesta]|nr:small oligopeptide transporter [Pholiota molesta]
MSRFHSKEDLEISAADDEFHLSTARKSLDNREDSSSTYSARLSGTESPFDPNYDSNSILEDDSPYPEVRSAVANFDDPDMPASTIRAWVLGIFWAILLPGMNQFFYFRYPSVVIGGLVAQLLVFPIGRAWVRICPSATILGFELNPGPFTIKEHVLVTIMASVGAQSAYANDIVAVQRVLYLQTRNFSFWPNTLVSCALFNTLHSQTYAGIGPRDGLTRERFFLYAFAGAITWYIVPGYLFQALRYFFSSRSSLLMSSQKVNQIFGYHSGLGFSILTLDWNQIAFVGSPLATPWWAEANVMIGFFFFYCECCSSAGGRYLNVWHSQYMPISSLQAYDNTGHPYDVLRVLTADHSSLNMTAYQDYSPLYLPTAFVMSYGLSFLSITATITHAIIHFWKPIRLQFGRAMREQPDIHARLMAHYPQVPEWYYACIFAITFVFACICIQVWPSGMTIWALIIALLISLVYVVPIGMIQAVTNRQVGLNVITELIVGFMIPGKPNAMMMCTYGYITMAQAMQFTADFKLGQSIPPRPMFWCQIVATVIAGTVQLGVQSWDLCTMNQKDSFTCASTQVFGTASIIWGVIGPGLQFTKGQIYYGLSFFFLIGAACPILLWFLTRRYPNTILNYLKLIFSGVGQIPPATAVNYVPWAIIGFIFQYVVRRKHFSYWAKYNCELSGSGSSLQYPLNGNIGRSSVQQWWGNTVYKNTLDWNMTALRKLEGGMTFGTTKW